MEQRVWATLAPLQVREKEVPSSSPPPLWPPPSALSPLLTLLPMPTLASSLLSLSLASLSLCENQGEPRSPAPFVLPMGKPWSRERGRNRVRKLDCSLGDVIQGWVWPPQNLSLQRSQSLPVTPQQPSMVRDATDSETHSFDKSLLSTYCVPCR